MLANNIQQYLITQIENLNISRKDLACKCSISQTLMHNLLHATRPNPSLSTIIKIADAFDSSVDAIVMNSNGVKLNNFNNNPALALREYIISTLQSNSEHPVKLAQTLGLGAESIKDFIKTNPKKNSLGIATIVKLANHWDVSVDEMIGRTPPSKAKEVSLPQKPSIAGIASLKSIKESMKGIALEARSSSSKTATSTIIAKNHKKDTGHSR